MKPIWFVNYSEQNSERTTAIKVYTRLQDAIDFAQGKYGYIIRQEGRNELVQFFGGFVPSATEQDYIRQVLSN